MSEPEYPDAVKTAEEAKDDNYWTNENGGGDGLIKGQGVAGAWEESSFKEDFDKAWDAATGVLSGEQSVLEAAGDIESFVSGLPIAGMITDPLHTLLTVGLGFLIDVIKPLDDALKLVTGDEEELKNAAEEFGVVSEQLGTLAQDFKSKIGSGLSSWQGESANAARERLVEFGAGIEDTKGVADSIVTLLNGSAALMKTAYDLVMDLIASFVEWLIITWLAAQAAAVPTLGASEVAAAGATAAEIAIATTRVGRIVQRVTAVLKKIGRVLKVLSGKLAGPKWWRNTAEKFAGKDAMAAWNKTPGWGPAAKQFGKDALSNAGTTLVDSAKDGGKDVYDMATDEGPDHADINRKLSI